MYSMTSCSSSPSPNSPEPDVFIAGGGPAGLACAIAAAQQGLTVEVADGMAPPIDKACGEGLMPDTIQALVRLGIDPGSSESFPFRGIRFLDAKRSKDPVGHSTVSVEATFPRGQGLGIRRLLLHQLLIDRAVALGVRFSWKTVVQGIEAAPGVARPKVKTNRGALHPRFIIGADGHQSQIRTWASLDRACTSARRIGLRQHFAIAPWTNHVEVYWSDHGQAYVTPTSSREVCVAFVTSRKFKGVAEALSHFPGLQEHLRSAVATDKPRGAITVSCRLHRVTSGNVALVGDASGSVDAVTGEGLGLCFRQALALAEALMVGNLAPYEQAHQAIQRLPRFMARAMLLLDRSSSLRHHTLGFLQRYPGIFQRLLEVHVGEPPFSFSRQPVSPAPEHAWPMIEQPIEHDL